MIAWGTMIYAYQDKLGEDVTYSYKCGLDILKSK